MTEEVKDEACRFCKTQITIINPTEEEAFKKVCKGCAPLCELMCSKTHSCGHHCQGSRDEKNCLRCLDESCQAKPT